MRTARRIRIALYLVIIAAAGAAVVAEAADAHFTASCQKDRCKRHVHRTGPGHQHLRAIRACESGGNYRAVSAGGTYRGAYQFDRRTWATVGGAGDPAAASKAEQDYRATILYARRGPQPWPRCGR